MELVFKTLKKYWIWPKLTYSVEKVWNSKFSHLFTQILFFTANDSFADVWRCVPRIKFWKNEDSYGIKVFHLALKSIEKVWKIGFENVWEPCIKLSSIAIAMHESHFLEKQRHCFWSLQVTISGRPNNSGSASLILKNCLILVGKTGYKLCELINPKQYAV